MQSQTNDILSMFRSQVHRNLTAEQLTRAAVARGEGRIVNDGSLAVSTGKLTGRSGGDKYVVRNPRQRTSSGGQGQSTIRRSPF